MNPICKLLIFLVGFGIGVSTTIWTVFKRLWLAVILLALLLWVSFNPSIGLVVGIQISFLQSMAFIILLKTLKGAIAS
jgi:hypothetical protein